MFHARKYLDEAAANYCVLGVMNPRPGSRPNSTQIRASEAFYGDLDITIRPPLADFDETLRSESCVYPLAVYLHISYHRLTQAVIKGSRSDTTIRGARRSDLRKGDGLIRIEDIFAITGCDSFDIAID